MAYIGKDVMDSFVTSYGKHQDKSDEELLNAFPEFNNDTTILSAAKDYFVTKTNHPDVSDDEFEKAFPELFGIPDLVKSAMDDVEKEKSQPIATLSIPSIPSSDDNIPIPMMSEKDMIENYKPKTPAEIETKYDDLYKRSDEGKRLWDDAVGKYTDQYIEMAKEYANSNPNRFSSEEDFIKSFEAAYKDRINAMESDVLKDYRSGLGNKYMKNMQDEGLDLAYQGIDVSGYEWIPKSKINDYILEGKFKKVDDEFSSIEQRLKNGEITRDDVERMNDDQERVRIIKEYQDRLTNIYKTEIKNQNNQLIKLRKNIPNTEVFNLDRRRLDVAQHILQKADEIATAPKNYDEHFGKWIVDFIKSGKVISDVDYITFGLLSAAENELYIRPILNKLKENNFDESVLDNSEKAIIDALRIQFNTVTGLDKNISNAYKGGKIAFESIPFMAEFFMTEGANVWAKGLTKGLIKKGATKGLLKKIATADAKRIAAKKGIELTDDVVAANVRRVINKEIFDGMLDMTVGSIARIPFMPSTYSGMINEMGYQTSFDDAGKIIIEDGASFGKALYDVASEVVSEGSGWMIDIPLGKVFNKIHTKMPKNIGKLSMKHVPSFSSLYTMSIAGLRRGGIHGIGGELFEEVFKNGADFAVSALTNDEEWFEQNKEFWTEDNLTQMVIGFSALPFIGGVRSVVGLCSAVHGKHKSMDKLNEVLTKYNFTDEQKKSLLADIENKKLKDILPTIDNVCKEHGLNAIQTGDIKASVESALMNQAMYDTFCDQDYEFDYNLKQAVQNNELAKKLYYNFNYVKALSLLNKDGKMHIARLNDGREGFIVGDVYDDGKTRSLIFMQADGQRQIIKPSEIENETETPFNPTQIKDISEKQYKEGVNTGHQVILDKYKALREKAIADKKAQEQTTQVEETEKKEGSQESNATSTERADIKLNIDVARSKKDVQITGKVKYNEDGSIDFDNSQVIIVSNGHTVKKSNQDYELYTNAINTELINQRLKQKAAEEAAAQKKADEEKAANAEAVAADEKQKEFDSIISSIKLKQDGTFAAETTPEQIVCAWIKKYGKEVTVKRITSIIIDNDAHLEQLSNDKKISQEKRFIEEDRLTDNTEAYIAAVEKWIGKDAVDNINAERVKQQEQVQQQETVVPAQEAQVQETPVTETPKEEPVSEPVVQAQDEEQAPVQEPEQVPVQEQEVPEVSEVAEEEPTQEPEQQEEKKEIVNLEDDDIVLLHQPGTTRYAIARKVEENGETRYIQIYKDGSSKNELRDGSSKYIKIWNGDKEVWKEIPKKIVYNYQDRTTPLLVLSAKPFDDLGNTQSKVKVVPTSFTGDGFYNMPLANMERRNLDSFEQVYPKKNRKTQQEDISSATSLDDALDRVVFRTPDGAISMTLRDILAMPEDMAARTVNIKGVETVRKDVSTVYDKVKQKIYEHYKATSRDDDEAQAKLQYALGELTRQVNTSLNIWNKIVADNNLNEKFENVLDEHNNDIREVEQEIADLKGQIEESSGEDKKELQDILKEKEKNLEGLNSRFADYYDMLNRLASLKEASAKKDSDKISAEKKMQDAEAIRNRVSLEMPKRFDKNEATARIMSTFEQMKVIMSIADELQSDLENEVTFMDRSLTRRAPRGEKRREITKKDNESKEYQNKLSKAIEAVNKATSIEQLDKLLDKAVYSDVKHDIQFNQAFANKRGELKRALSETDVEQKKIEEEKARRAAAEKEENDKKAVALLGEDGMNVMNGIPSDFTLLELAKACKDAGLSVEKAVIISSFKRRGTSITHMQELYDKLDGKIPEQAPIEEPIKPKRKRITVEQKQETPATEETKETPVAETTATESPTTETSATEAPVEETMSNDIEAKKNDLQNQLMNTISQLKTLTQHPRTIADETGKRIADPEYVKEKEELLAKRQSLMDEIKKFKAENDVQFDIEDEFFLTSEAASKAIVDTLVKAGIPIVRISEKDLPKYISNKKIKQIKNNEGVVYGFAKGNTIYLVEERMNANTPVHEYTHLWVTIFAQQNPKEWEQYKRALKRTNMWKYVSTNKKYKSIWGDEEEIASEVMARLTGERYGAVNSEEQSYFEQVQNSTLESRLADTGAISTIRKIWYRILDWFGIYLPPIRNTKHFDKIEQKYISTIINQPIYDLLRASKIIESMKDESNFDRFVRLMSVFHGSVADFDEFDFSFIGTGEGSQVFGWGAYFSKVKGVALGYMNMILDYKREEMLSNSYYIVKMPSQKTGKVIEFETHGVGDLRKIANENFDFDEVSLFNKIMNFNNYDGKENLLLSFNYDKERLEYYEENLKKALYNIKKYESLSTIEEKNDYKQMIYNAGYKNIEDLYDEASQYKKVVDMLSRNVSLYKYFIDNHDKISVQKKIDNIELNPIVYTANIPDDTGDNYMPWDEVVSYEMYHRIYDALVEFINSKESVPLQIEKNILYTREDGSTFYGRGRDAYLLYPKFTSQSNPTGEDIYEGIAKMFSTHLIGVNYDKYKGWEQASKFLYEKCGIVGNRVSVNYAHSGKVVVKKNYVVFNAKDIDITNKERFDIESKYINSNDFNPDGTIKDSVIAEIAAERRKIIAEAKENGIYMLAPNGLPTKLTEDEWVTVRTSHFKKWFGDWENPNAENVSVVIDKYGDKPTYEPLVVYHGSRTAGFDKFRFRYRDSQGVYTTPTRHAANRYAATNKERIDDIQVPDAKIGVEERGVYPLFANIKNPVVYDFQGRDWYQYETEPIGYFIDMSKGEIYDEDEIIRFDTREEAEEFCARNNLNPETEIQNEYTTTDDLLKRAREEGYDGCIFLNVKDGDVVYENGKRIDRPMTDFVALESNQLKSATENVGTFNEDEERMQFQIEDFDNAQQKRLEKLSTQVIERALDVNTQLPEQLSDMGKLIFACADRTEGIRQLMSDINEWRVQHGKHHMPAAFDVRTRLESMENSVREMINMFRNNEEEELKSVVQEMIPIIKKSALYKKYKTDALDPRITLTPTEFIERYLIAMDSIESIRMGLPETGEADFYQRMHNTDVKTFAEEFQSLFANTELVDKLHKSVKAISDYGLDILHDADMISDESYDQLKARDYYVPERDNFAIDKMTDEESSHQPMQRGKKIKPVSTGYKREGRKTLATNIFGNLIFGTLDAIEKAKLNEVKLVFYDMLMDNLDFCKAAHIPQPTIVYYKKIDGEYVRIEEGPTADEIKKYKELHAQVNEWKARMAQLDINDTEEKATIEGIIRDLEEQYPYLDDIDTKNIHKLETENASDVVPFYINGRLNELYLPNMTEVALALNNKFSPNKTAMTVMQKINGWFSGIVTTHNPEFILVNEPRDIQSIARKGTAEYGLEFELRFLGKWAYNDMARKSLCRYLRTGKIDTSTDIGKRLKSFLVNGGAAGYTLELSMRKLRDDIKKWERNGEKFTFDKLWRPVQMMNEYGEMITRFSAYCALLDMDKSEVEATNGALNLSLNLNRKGYGAYKINKKVTWITYLTDYMNSLSIFANAAIQGNSSVWRSFKGTEEEKKKRIWHTTRAVLSMAAFPMIAGYFATLLNPDDDDDEYQPTDYSRCHNFIYGNLKIALSQEIIPFWTWGVCAAQKQMNRMDNGRFLQNIVDTAINGLIPSAPLITEGFISLYDLAFGKGEQDIAQIALKLFTTQSLQNVYDLSMNRNFVGSKLKYEIGNKPEYIYTDNTSWIYNILAELAYHVGEGENDAFPSKYKQTKDENGNIIGLEEMKLNFNPKQIKAAAFPIPAGYMNAAASILGLGAWAFSDKEEGPVDSGYIQAKDIFAFNRYYQPANKDIYRYMIRKDAREILKPYEELHKDSQNYLATADESNLKDITAAYVAKYRTELILLDTYAKIYDECELKRVRQRLGNMSKKEMKNKLPDVDYEKIDAEQKEAAAMMKICIYMIKGVELGEKDREKWLKASGKVETDKAPEPMKKK